MKDLYVSPYEKSSDCSCGEDVYFVDGTQVIAVLDKTGRAYLVGHLERLQSGLTHVGELASNIEVGISRYSEATVDMPHLHKWNTDITIVLDGLFAVRIIPTGASRVITPGGTCVIEPGIAHVCVASAKTQVLFVKTPGGNDKELVELDEGAKEWVDETLTLFEGAGVSLGDE